MKPPPFAFRDATTLADALKLLAADEFAYPIAGGQSLVPMLNFRLIRPSVVVDLNGIDELAGIEVYGDRALIRAMTRQVDVMAHAELAVGWPLIRAALGFVAHPQIRNRGTIGGSCVHNDPAAELPSAMLALDVTMAVQSQSGARTIAAADFFVGPLTTALEPGEILTAIELPAQPADHGYGFAEVARRHGDYALAAAAVLMSHNNGARIVVTGMGNGPQRIEAAEQALVASDFGEAALDEVRKLVSNAVSPIDDQHAPAWYRARVAGEMAARACADAIRRMELGAK